MKHDRFLIVGNNMSGAGPDVTLVLGYQEHKVIL